MSQRRVSIYPRRRDVGDTSENFPKSLGVRIGRRANQHVCLRREFKVTKRARASWDERDERLRKGASFVVVTPDFARRRFGSHDAATRAGLLSHVIPSPRRVISLSLSFSGAGTLGPGNRRGRLISCSSCVVSTLRGELSEKKKSDTSRRAFSPTASSPATRIPPKVRAPP